MCLTDCGDDNAARAEAQLLVDQLTRQGHVGEVEELHACACGAGGRVNQETQTRASGQVWIHTHIQATTMSER